MRLLRSLFGAKPPPLTHGGITGGAAEVQAPVTPAPTREQDALEASTSAPGPMSASSSPAVGGAPLHAVQLAATAQKTVDELKLGVTRDGLTRGRGFAQIDAADIQAVVGHAITHEGLTRLYAGCLPGTTPVLTACSCDGERKLSYMVSWFDGAGREVARAGRDLKKRNDGSLELHQHTVWVSPEVRGRGVSAKALVQERQMLRALSSHKNTAITLRAGWMFDVNDAGKKEERVGSYAWAQFGFDFADAHGLGVFTAYGTRIPGESEAERALPTLALVRARFVAYVDALIEREQLPSDPAIRGALHDAAAAFQHPWEVASFHVEGLTVPVEIGGRTLDCHLGKAFLTSGFSVAWDGAVFVNADKPGLPIHDAYCSRCVRDAVASEAGTRARWLDVLATDDPATLLPVLEEIGRFGDPSWIPLLERVTQRGVKNRDVDDALALATQRLAREADRARVQRERGTDVSLSHGARVTALEAAMELAGGHTDWAWFTRLVRDATVPGVVATSAATALIRREGLSDQVADLFLKSDDASASLDRMSDWFLHDVAHAMGEQHPLGRAAIAATQRRWDARQRELRALREKLDADAKAGGA